MRISFFAFIAAVLFSLPVYAADECLLNVDCMTGNAFLDQCHDFKCEDGNCVTTPRPNNSPCNADGDQKTCGTCMNAGDFGFACVENNPWMCLLNNPPSEGFCNRASDCMTGNSNMDQCHQFFCENNRCMNLPRTAGRCNADGNPETCGVCQDTAFGFACLEEQNTCGQSPSLSCGKDGLDVCVQNIQTYLTPGSPYVFDGQHICYDNLKVAGKKAETIQPPSVNVTVANDDGVTKPKLICTAQGCGTAGHACCGDSTLSDHPFLACRSGLFCNKDLLCTDNPQDEISPYDQSCLWRTYGYNTVISEDRRQGEVSMTINADCPDNRDFTDHYIFTADEPISADVIPNTLSEQLDVDSSTRRLLH